MTTLPVETPTSEAPLAVSDEPVALPEGRLACSGCGVAATRPAPPVQVVRVPVVKVYSPAGRPLGETQVALGMCSTCGDRAHAAVALAAAHPALSAALGQHRAVEAAEGILTALAVLGLDAPATDLPDKRLGILVRNLATVGLGIRWRTHIAAENLIDSANPHPWAHVRAGERLRLREAYAAALAERVLVHSGPVKVAPPSISPRAIQAGQEQVGGACGICGVGHVSVPATTVARAGGREAVARSTWRLHTGVSPDSLGARRSPVRLAIWLCPACEDAYVWEQSMGASMMERALYAHLDRLGSLGPDVEVPGLVGWAGLCADALRRGRPLPKPGRVPWDHVDVTGV